MYSFWRKSRKWLCNCIQVSKIINLFKLIILIFHLSRIIQEYKLKAVKIYCQSGRLLAKAKRHSAVPNLVKCIRSGCEKDNVLTEMCDEMLALTAKTLGEHNATDRQLEDIIKHISNRTMKVSL